MMVMKQSEARAERTQADLVPNVLAWLVVLAANAAMK